MVINYVTRISKKKFSLFFMKINSFSFFFYLLKTENRKKDCTFIPGLFSYFLTSKIFFSFIFLSCCCVLCWECCLLCLCPLVVRIVPQVVATVKVMFVFVIRTIMELIAVYTMKLSPLTSLRITQCKLPFGNITIFM
jgi:hypothetical protein